MVMYWSKGVIKEISDEYAEMAMDEFEKRFLEIEDEPAWLEARLDSFDAANSFSSERYNINLEQFIKN